jgi:hypothetical protein
MLLWRSDAATASNPRDKGDRVGSYGEKLATYLKTSRARELVPA